MRKTTKEIFLGSSETLLTVLVNGENIEAVKHYLYQGVKLYPEGSDLNELKMQLAVAREKVFDIKDLFTRNLRLWEMKLKLPKSFVWSIGRYASETGAIARKIIAKITSLDALVLSARSQNQFTSQVKNENVLIRVNLQEPAYPS